MSRRDVDRRFDEIVEFAGLERFLDTPLKRYSWGMYLRLAFAVAAHVEPDIVIVDEVLAVGDARFRAKCLEKMSEFGQEGRTVVFVSHDLGSITQLCRRAIWLDHGQIQADGPSEEIVQRYVRGSIGDVPRADFTPDPTQRVQVLAAEVADEDGRPLDHPERGQPLTLRVRFVVREPLPVVAVGLSVQDQRGIRVLDEVWGEHGGDVLAIDDAPREVDVALTCRRSFRRATTCSASGSARATTRSSSRRCSASASGRRPRIRPTRSTATASCSLPSAGRSGAPTAMSVPRRPFRSRS